MSKLDAQRAMREAKFARDQGRAQARSGTPARRPAPVAPEAAPATEVAADASTDGLCGHRSMNGRTCTRETGHAAKSHRYG